MSETAKYRHLVLPYCRGLGVDVGCGNDIVAPSAIGVDLPDAEFVSYTAHTQESAAHIEARADALPFRSGSLGFVYSSHLLEDFYDWKPVLREWWRILKIGGHLIVLIPDHELFQAAVNRGQPPNCRHKHEGRAGELSEVLSSLGESLIIRDSLTGLSPEDYSILFVARKLQ